MKYKNTVRMKLQKSRMNLTFQFWFLAKVISDLIYSSIHFGKHLIQKSTTKKKKFAFSLQCPRLLSRRQEMENKPCPHRSSSHPPPRPALSGRSFPPCTTECCRRSVESRDTNTSHSTTVVSHCSFISTSSWATRAKIFL